MNPPSPACRSSTNLYACHPVLFRSTCSFLSPTFGPPPPETPVEIGDPKETLFSFSSRSSACLSRVLFSPSRGGPRRCLFSPFSFPSDSRVSFLFSFSGVRRNEAVAFCFLITSPSSSRAGVASRFARRCSDAKHGNEQPGARVSFEHLD